MRPDDPLDLFWTVAHAESPVLTHDDLVRTSRATRERLLASGLLRPGPTAWSVVCDACYSGHAGEVTRETYPDGSTEFVMCCPEYGRTTVHADRLRQWLPDYSRVAQLLADAFHCTGSAAEPVPGRLWNLGRAALAGQSRTVWLGRRLTDDLHARLRLDRLSLLFVMGAMPEALPDIAPDRVFDLRGLVSIDDGELVLDADAVRGQLGDAVKAGPPAPAKPRKREARTSAEATVKGVLREQADLRRRALKRNWDAELPALTQKQLAEYADISEATLSRILNDASAARDREIQVLWSIINDPEQLDRYRG